MVTLVAVTRFVRAGCGLKHFLSRFFRLFVGLPDDRAYRHAERGGEHSYDEQLSEYQRNWLWNLLPAAESGIALTSAQAEDTGLENQSVLCDFDLGKCGGD